MKKVLPYVVDAKVKTECWTQVLLSIIQTSEYASAWIASHFQMFTGKDLSPYYGNVYKQFDYRDATDILDFNEVDIFSIAPKSIVPWIINEINNNNYILIQLKYNAGNTYRLHETLLYGFDTDNQTFFTTVINNNTQKIEASEISFNELILKYSDIYEHLKNKETKDEFTFIYNRNYPITKIVLRRDYSPCGCEYNFIRRMIEEFYGKCYKIQEIGPGEIATEENNSFSGICCLLAARNKINNIINDRIYIEQDTDIIYNDLFDEIAEILSKDLYKIYEFRCINFESLKWFFESVKNYENTSYMSLVEEYSSCCTSMRSIYQLAMKFRKKRNWNILESLLKKIETQYAYEYSVLEKMLPVMSDLWYKSKTKRID